jgi:hypothetical protein
MTKLPIEIFKEQKFSNNLASKKMYAGYVGNVIKLSKIERLHR